MNQKHVPDLELCQELDRLCKENNITLPETEFYWDAVAGGSIEIVKAPSASSNITNKERCHDELSNISIPAPLVSELGEWLPWIIDTGCVNFDNCPSWHRVTYYLGEHYLEQTASTEANARQKMLNYLIVERIITTL